MFFALLPDDQTRAAIAARAARLPRGGRAVPAANYHITLRFVGRADAARLRCLCHAAAMVEPRPFSLALDRVGVFGRAGALWLGAGRPDAGLLAWREALVARLAADCGLRPERQAWIPHVTLRRKWHGEPPQGPLDPVLWQGDGGFHLMCSEADPAGGVRYHSLAVFPRPTAG